MKKTDRKMIKELGYRVGLYLSKATNGKSGLEIHDDGMRITGSMDIVKELLSLGSVLSEQKSTKRLDPDSFNSYFRKVGFKCRARWSVEKKGAIEFTNDKDTTEFWWGLAGLLNEDVNDLAMSFSDAISEVVKKDEDEKD